MEEGAFTKLINMKGGEYKWIPLDRPPNSRNNEAISLIIKNEKGEFLKWQGREW